MVSIKEEVRQLIENLPEDITWDELLDRLYVRKTIAAGLADSEEGRVTPVDEVRRKFDLDR
jgi:predicted transcriptional regulator